MYKFFLTQIIGGDNSRPKNIGGDNVPSVPDGSTPMYASHKW